MDWRVYLDRIRSFTYEQRTALGGDQDLLNFTHTLLHIYEHADSEGYEDLYIDLDKRVVQDIVRQLQQVGVPLIGFRMQNFTIGDEIRFELAGMPGEAARCRQPGTITDHRVCGYARGSCSSTGGVLYSFTQTFDGFRPLTQQPQYNLNLTAHRPGLTLTEPMLRRAVHPPITIIRRKRAIR